MKKGFTMIELIFVIVILGILAAVAIPRLAATRDDAEITKTISNTALVVRDMTSYYTAQGHFDKTAANMTNVQLVTAKDTPQAKAGAAELKDDETTATVFVPFKGEPCVGIKLLGASAGLELIDNSKQLGGSTQTACAAVVKAPGVKSIIESKFDNDGDATTPEINGLKVGGTSDIKY